MANPKCCNKTMEKQEIHYGQNWLCLECGSELKTPANGMTQKDIDGYYAARSKFAAILIHEEAVRRGRAGGISGTGDAKKRGDSEHYKKMRAEREAKRVDKRGCMDTEKEHRCLRCGHEWNSRCPDGESFKTWKPVICPACKSPYWNKKSRNQQEAL